MYPIVGGRSHMVRFHQGRYQYIHWSQNQVPLQYFRDLILFCKSDFVNLIGQQIWEGQGGAGAIRRKTSTFFF